MPELVEGTDSLVLHLQTQIDVMVQFPVGRDEHTIVGCDLDILDGRILKASSDGVSAEWVVIKVGKEIVPTSENLKILR